jgi:anti-anti-sigma regulatory factor
VLLPGDGLILLSDGITQAGIGNSLAEGWQSAGVAEFISASACELDGQGLLERILQQARALWPSQAGDDMTAALLEARCGKVVNLLTGPPASASRDAQVVREFLDAQGTHVVCGATTASIVARHTGRSLQVDPDHKSLLAPPKYALAAADLVTEGSVTLNQVYNILDADPADWVDPSGVTELAALLKQADRVNITLGLTANPANAGMHFRQQGLLSRAKIVELLAGKLREMGKLVVVHSV